MSNFVAQIMQPGGGVMLLPFVRVVISILLILTLTAAVMDVARIHMIILSFLSGGLLISLSFFESEFNKVRATRESNSGGGGGSSSGSGTTTMSSSTAAAQSNANKTD